MEMIHYNGTALLSTTYFGPVQWYQKLARYDHVLIERHESYRKQTYRNRCIIAAANGPQALTVPVSIDSGTGDILVSDHGNWPHQHWQAITSAYGDSPFLQYYEDDLRPFFNGQWQSLTKSLPQPLQKRGDESTRNAGRPLLHDFNEAIRATVCRLLDITPSVAFTSAFIAPASVSDAPASAFVIGGFPADFRDSIDPKRPAPDPQFTPRPYYQVYSRRHGFLPNLSILDLLLNMGPEAIFCLA